MTPEDGGIVNSEPSVSCPADCTGFYLNGASVTLPAAAKAGFAFAGWSGDCCGGAGFDRAKVDPSDVRRAIERMLS